MVQNPFFDYHCYPKKAFPKGLKILKKAQTLTSGKLKSFKLMMKASVALHHNRKSIEQF